MRLFVGIPVPAELRQQIQVVWEQVSQKPFHCRMIDPKLWHLTLAFLGDIDERMVPNLSDLIATSMTTPPEGHFVLSHFQSFPARRPTLLVASAEVEQHKAWNRSVEKLRDLLSVMAPQVDRKPWHPHITIGRSKKRTQKLPSWQTMFEPLPWKPEGIALVHSSLTSTGPHYTHLQQFPLRAMMKD